MAVSYFYICIDSSTSWPLLCPLDNWQWIRLLRFSDSCNKRSISVKDYCYKVTLQPKISCLSMLLVSRTLWRMWLHLIDEIGERETIDYIDWFTCDSPLVSTKVEHWLQAISRNARWWTELSVMADLMVEKILLDDIFPIVCKSGWFVNFPSYTAKCWQRYQISAYP